MGVRGAHWAGVKMEVVLRLARRLARARRSAAVFEGEGVGGGASLEPIRKGRVTNRSASACACNGQNICSS